MSVQAPQLPATAPQLPATATPEELFADAYDEAGRVATKIVMGWYRGCRSPRWIDDLHSAAMEMLWVCAVRFDADRGVPFSHYWRTRLRGAMVDEARRLFPGSRSVRPPSYWPLDEEFDRVDNDRTPDDIAVANIAMDELEAAVAALPRSLRVAIDGCREGTTQRAISVAEGVTEGSIGQRKVVARRILGRRLGPRAA